MTVVIGDWEFDHATYDAESDVLYLSIGGPREGIGEESPEGHILRFDEEGEFYGVTLIGVKHMLEAGERSTTITLPRRESISSTTLEPVLA
jgi:uncharacterized protein YuzE